MNNLVLVLILIGQLTTTSYRPVRLQTDDSPYYTSTNDHVHAGGCAVSRDLLCPACRKLHRRCARPDNPTKLHYGDWLYVDGFGFLQINDVMGSYTSQRVGRRWVRHPITRHIDIFVWTYKQERAVGVKTANVYKVEEKRHEQ